MPAALSHYLLANKVFDKMKDAYPQHHWNADAFLWGAQGPDFLFTHRFFPWQKGESLAVYGEKLHHDAPVRTMEFMQKYCKNISEQETALSYVLGFLCHYSFDSTAHPFINYGAKQLHEQIDLSTEGTCHNTIEAALDVILLRYVSGALPTDISLKTTVPKNVLVRDMMASLYDKLLEQFYAKSNSRALLLQAIRDCRAAFGLMTDRTTLKKQLAERIEKKKKIPPFASCHVRPLSEGDEYDYANVLQAEWLDKACQIHTESFLELYEHAADYAGILIDGFLKEKNLHVLTQDQSF